MNLPRATGRVSKMLVSKRIQEVDIAVPMERLDVFAGALVSRGLLHPVELPPNFPGEVKRRAQRQVYELGNKLAKIERYLSEINVYNPMLEGVEVKVGNVTWEHVAEKAILEFQKTEEEFDQIIDAINRSKERLDSLKTLKNQLEPFRETDVDLEWVSSMRLLSISLGLLPKVSLSMVISKLEKLPAYFLLSKDAGEDHIAVLVVTRRKDQREVGTILREAGFQQIQIPETLPQNPAKAYEKVSREIMEFEKEIARLRGKIASNEKQLREKYSYLLTIREALRVIAASKTVGRISFLKGFIPHGTLEELRRLLEEHVGEGLYLLRAAGEVPGVPVKKTVPTLVDVPRPLKPFQWIVNQYGTPGSSEIIPTILVAITFPLLYGLMFPDAGQALVIIAFGIYMLKTAKGRESRENIGLLAIYVGIASFITGFLSGEFFGPLTGFKYLVWDGHPPMAAPIEGDVDTIWLMMTIAFRIAAFMLISGTLFAVINSLVERDYEGAFMVKLPKFVAFASATFPFLIHDVRTAGSVINDAVFGGATTLEGMVVRYGTILGLLGLFLLEPLYELARHGFSGFKSRLGIGFLELFETALLIIGNTASFLRIVGVSLAHAGIMFGFAILAELAAGGVIGNIFAALIYLFGNILAIGLEGIIVYAQTLRLHYYEWFTKFYSGAGIPFQPAYAPVRIVLPTIS